jgi:hypothetical protein
MERRKSTEIRSRQGSRAPKQLDSQQYAAHPRHRRKSVRTMVKMSEIIFNAGKNRPPQPEVSSDFTGSISVSKNSKPTVPAFMRTQVDLSQYISQNYPSLQQNEITNLLSRNSSMVKSAYEKRRKLGEGKQLHRPHQTPQSRNMSFYDSQSIVTFNISQNIMEAN